MLNGKLIIDNFAGGGGASEGIFRALGVHPDVAINHDREALAMHEANHPDTIHYQTDVWDVDPLHLTQGAPVALAWFSPDCFPAGTLVLTRRGYEPIETIQVGDTVFTHRGRWRPVTEVSSTRRRLLTVRGHGHPGIRVSREHPFYTRAHQRSAPEWTPAGALRKGDYWATPCSFPRDLVPEVGGRGMTPNASLMWLAGRYLGDGWSRLTEARAEMVIICGKHEEQEIADGLVNAWPRSGERAAADELAWHRRETATALQFSTNHRGLVTWLRKHFGHLAPNKQVPAWALGMPVNLRRALLDGYLSADGHRTSAFWEMTTVSKRLVFGVKALAESLGHTVTVYTGPNSSEIQGRAVNCKPVWRARWRHAVDSSHRQTFRTGGALEWAPIREVSEPDEGFTRVFNIGVADDESYVVEGIVVHNCKHFSKAKGGKPVEKKIRGLAWVAVKYAKALHPDVIMLENVEEFRDWGPIDPETNLPLKDKLGLTYRRFTRALVNEGYVVEDRELTACDYGAPTKRKRLFMVARRDGHPIAWPEITHGPGRLPYQTAADCIDFSIPCRSIFGRSKPLADNTLRRIARGIQKFVIDNPRPFILKYYSEGGQWSRLDEPMHTIPTVDRMALVTPVITRIGHTGHGDSGKNHSVDSPLRTVTSKAEHLLVAPYMVPRYGERPGQDPRCLSVEGPMPTVVPTQNGASVVAAFLAKHNGGNEATGQRLEVPCDTITATDSKAVVTSHLMKMRGTCAHGQRTDEPTPTVTAGGFHLAEVRALLVRFMGEGIEPIVTIDGEEWVIVDIGMRMLTPRELARAQGFGDGYILDPIVDGKPLPARSQVRMIGNSVSPDQAEALVRANFAHALEERESVAA